MRTVTLDRVARGPLCLGFRESLRRPQGDYIFILFNTTGTVLVRTQNIWDIQSRSEWITTATGPGQGARVYLQGPPLPIADLGRYAGFRRSWEDGVLCGRGF